MGKEDFGARLQQALELNNIKAIELSERTGISRGALSSYISGRWKAKQDNLYRIAKALNVSPAWLMGYDVPMEWDDSPSQSTTTTSRKGVKIPVLGYVVAGVPIEAVEDILGYEEISVDLARTGDFFCLRIKGDSMEPTFAEGDIIVVRQQPDVESNEIAVVLVNGDEGTVKRIKKSDNGITLIGDNVSSFLPTFYSNEDIERLPVTIIGKVIELRRSF